VLKKAQLLAPSHPRVRALELLTGACDASTGAGSGDKRVGVGGGGGGGEWDRDFDAAGGEGSGELRDGAGSSDAPPRLPRAGAEGNGADEEQLLQRRLSAVEAAVAAGRRSGERGGRAAGAGREGCSGQERQRLLAQGLAAAASAAARAGGVAAGGAAGRGGRRGGEGGGRFVQSKRSGGDGGGGGGGGGATGDGDRLSGGEGCGDASSAQYEGPAAPPSPCRTPSASHGSLSSDAEDTQDSAWGGGGHPFSGPFPGRQTRKEGVQGRGAGAVGGGGVEGGQGEMGEDYDGLWEAVHNQLDDGLSAQERADFIRDLRAQDQARVQCMGDE
jgi:hypothetical protein